MQEDVCIFQTEHSESVVVEMKTTVNDKSDEVIRLLIDPRRDLSNPEEQTVSSPCVSQEIINLCEPTSAEDQVFAQCSDGSAQEILVYMIIPLYPFRNCSLIVWVSYAIAQKKLLT